MTARVLLGDTLVGRLTPAEENVSFTFDRGYLERPDRPILSRSFEELDLDVERVFTGVSRDAPLPTFFRNALPEGALRKVLEARMSRSRLVEYDMLLRLGGDLPGNVRVVSEAPAWTDDEEVEASTPGAVPEESDPIRFSLAGVQLKASVLAHEDRITLPLVGQAGDWITKFPSAVFRSLPENENAMLRWAHAAGLDVPEHRLIDVASIQNLPSEFPSEGSALLVRRFDRRPGGGRIHQEDFAQVFGAEPEDKYLGYAPVYAHHAGIGAVVRALCGPDDFLEYARRVAFVVLSGNTDAHMKNWALIYPDGVRAGLSPLYDVVATIAYPKLGSDLALGFVEPEDPFHTPGIAMATIEYRHFREMAARAGESPDEVEHEVRRFVERARAAWCEVNSDVPDFVRDAVTRHLALVSLR